MKPLSPGIESLKRRGQAWFASHRIGAISSFNAAGILLLSAGLALSLSARYPPPAEARSQENGISGSGPVRRPGVTASPHDPSPQQTSRAASRSEPVVQVQTLQPQLAPVRSYPVEVRRAAQPGVRPDAQTPIASSAPPETQPEAEDVGHRPMDDLPADELPDDDDADGE